MKDLLEKVKEGAKKHPQVVFTVLFVFGAILLYKVLPYYFMPKPRITEMTPTDTVVNTKFGESNNIVLRGENLGNVIGVYINDSIEVNCWILSNTEEEIILQIPEYYYAFVQDIEIQLEVRTNSDMTCLSNKVTLQVLSDEDIEQPVIGSVTPEKLRYEGSLRQNITVYGEGFTADSVVIIDEVAYPTQYDAENQSLSVEIPYEAWCGKDFLLLKVTQYYNGYPTQVVSEVYYYETEKKEADLSTDDSWDISTAGICSSLEEIQAYYENGERIIQVDVGLSADEVLYVRKAGETEVDQFGLPLGMKDMDVLSFEDLCDFMAEYSELYVCVNLAGVTSLGELGDYSEHILSDAGKAGKDVASRIVIPLKDEVFCRWLMEQDDSLNVLYITETVAEEVIEEEVPAPTKEENEAVMKEYLQALDSQRYLVFFTVQDEASMGMTEEMQKELQKFGLKESLIGAYRNSYIAIVDQGTVIYEALSTDTLQYEGDIDGVPYQVESGNANASNIASVQIDGVEYAVRGRGINIVVYDTITNSVINSVCFDSFDAFQMSQ